MGAMTWGESTSTNERGLAMVAHLSGLLLPIIGPGLLYLIKKDESQYVAYHSVQAILFQVICALLTGVTCGIGALTLILSIVWAVKAYNGEWQGYPLIDSVGRT